MNRFEARIRTLPRVPAIRWAGGQQSICRAYSMSEPSRVEQIGRHSALAEGDTVTLRIRGKVALAELQACLRFIERCFQAQGLGFVLVDHSEAGETGPEVRRELATWARMRRCSGIAVCGASFGLRVVSGLLVRGIARIYDRPDLIDRVGFFRTEAEARAFLAERKAHAQSSSAAPAPGASGAPGQRAPG